MTKVLSAPRRRSAKAQAHPQRRTQQQRRDDTQSLLLDATIACLSEVGYNQTSTTLVALRAGVSRGAQTHHFPTKDALVTAAVVRLSDAMVSALDEDLARCKSKPDVLEAFMQGIWRTKQGPLFSAGLEISVAARHIPSLKTLCLENWQRLNAVIQSHVQSVAISLCPDNPQPVALALHQSVLLVHAIALNEMLSGPVPENTVLFESMVARVRDMTFANAPSS